MKQGVIIIGLLILGGVMFGIPSFSEAAQGAAPGEVSLVESNAGHVVIDVAAPKLVSRTREVNGTTYVELNAQSWNHIDLPGKPGVPIFGTLVAIPQNAQLSVKILLDKTHSETLAHPVLPAPTPHVVQQDPDALPTFQGNDYIPDDSLYASASPYPVDIVNVGDPALWRSQRYVRVQIHPFQFSPATRQLTVHDRLRIEIRFGPSAGAPAAEAGTALSEGGFESVLKATLLNYDSARAWRTPERRSSGIPQPGHAASASNAFKISVNADGMYKVTCDALQAAGLDYTDFRWDVAKLSFLGNQVAIHVQEDGDNQCQSGEYFVFFGQAPTDFNIPYNVYWLRYDGQSGARMDLRSVSGSSTPASYTKTLRQEQNLMYVSYAPFVENADHWVSSFVNHPFDPDKNGDATSVDVPVDLPDLAPGSSNGTLRVLVQSGAQGNPYSARQSTLSSNGVPVSQQNWVSGTSLLALAAVNNLTAGSNVFRVADLSYLTGGIAVYLNYVELDYAAVFTAANDALRFKYASNGDWQYRVPNFSTGDVVAYDISNPLNAARLVVNTAPNGNTFTASFGDSVSAPREYIVLAPSQYKTPLTIVNDTPSTLSNPANGADYIIITYGAWKTNIQPLADQRSVMGRVQVVDVEDVYDEFNNGLVSASAIRSFLEYAYTTWQAPKPAYVLLVGNGNVDKGNNEATFIPVNIKLVDPWIGMTASDHRLVTLDAGSPLPSMAIGRLPALTAADVNGMVNKLLAYENNTPASTWRNKVLFVSDNAYDSNGNLDAAGNFFGYSEQVASDPYYFPAPMVADRAYYNPCNSAQYAWCSFAYPTYSASSAARAAILDAFSQGRLIVNYVGHGAVTAWAENMLKSTDAASLAPANGNPKYPFMLPMTCYDGYFHSGNSTSLSEALVRQANGGAIGSFAPTGLGVATGHDYLDRGFFQALMQGGKPRAGQAAIAAKVKLYAEAGYSLDLLDTFNLLGDPGTLFALPDEIMPTPTPTNTPTSTATPTNTPPVSGTPTVTPTATATIDSCGVKPNRTVLVAPENGSSLSTQRVTLRWNAGACVTKYRVVLKLGSKTGIALANVVVRNKTTYKTGPLLRNQTYFWRVKSCNTIGCRWSEWREFKVK